MKQFWTLMVIVALMTVSLVSCGSEEEVAIGEDEVVSMLNAVNPIQLTEAQRQMRDNNNEFAWRLFRAVRETDGNQGNTIMSPLSVTYLLGMMGAGAAGNTRDEISATLGFGDDAMAVNEYCKTMIDGAATVDPAATVKIANCVEVNSALGINLLSQYVDDMKHYYYAQIEAMDFTKSNALNIINNWCKDNTEGMIPRILDEINPNAAMYMLNAIYFKADWASKFNKDYTRKMDFTLDNGTTVKRDIMHIKAHAFYGHDEKCATLRLPFGNGAYSMYVLLPAEGLSLEDFIQGMTIQDLNAHLYNIGTGDIDVLLPKFETSSDIKLKEPLNSMGITSAFDPQRADFSNMTTASLYVSLMLQKAKIEINEDGGKAAAVTIAGYVLTSVGTTPSFDFHATRPFLYLILEESTHSIFFIGTFQGGNE
ncbi:MAG: serpin family protein [Muribaculaceae bacterium]|nr:serpin family protein [Muribaculaceae bacterium]